MRSMQQRTRSGGRGSAAFCALASFASLALLSVLSGVGLVAFVPPTSSAPSGGAAGRRNVLASAASASLLGLAGSPLVLAPQPARADVAWQLGLPRSWEIFSQSDQPPKGSKQSVALVVAGNADQGGDLVVLRAPLDSSDASPDKANSLNLIKYFSTPVGQTPSVSLQDTIKGLVSSSKTDPNLIKYEIVAQPMESIRNGRRYIRFDFATNICQGSIERAVKGDRCMDPESGVDFPTFDRTHAMAFTVNKDDGDVLWVVDLSFPTAEFKDRSQATEVLINSFEVGNPEKLEADRIANQKIMYDAMQKEEEARIAAAEEQKSKAPSPFPWR